MVTRGGGDMANHEQAKAGGPEADTRFEDILARLGSVVDKLEAGDLPLEDSLLLFEEGVRLSRLGTARLDEAERRVERLLRGEAMHKENEAP
jgi:exodeoxyribonuclease VII small subunit